MAYESDDVHGILPKKLHKAAIQYAKNQTGVHRPVKEHQTFISCFRECFLIMKELGMLKKEYEDVKK